MPNSHVKRPPETQCMMCSSEIPILKEGLLEDNLLQPTDLNLILKNPEPSACKGTLDFPTDGPDPNKSSTFISIFWEELKNIRRSLLLRKLSKPNKVESSAGLTLKEFFEKQSSNNNPRSVALVAGRVQVTGTLQSVQFVFKDGEELAQVVGVGCSRHAVVTISKSLKVKVVCNEHAWHQIWTEALIQGSSSQLVAFTKISSHFEPVLDHVTTFDHNSSSRRLAKQFGVGLESDSHLPSYVKVHNGSKWRRGEFMILMLARYLLLDEILETRFYDDYSKLARGQEIPLRDIFQLIHKPPYGGDGHWTWTWTSTLWTNLWSYLPNAVGKTQGTGSSGGRGNGNGGGDGGDEDDDDDDGEGDDDGSGRDGGLPPPPADLNLEEDGFAVVEVSPGYGGQWENKALLDKDLKDSNISPTLTFYFLKSKQRRELAVSICVMFDLGELAEPKSKDEEEHRFGWFHDNLKISLQSLSDNAASLKLNHQVVSEPDISKTTLTTSTSTTSNPFHVSIETPGSSRSPQSMFGIMGKLGISKDLKSGKTETIETSSQMIDRQIMGGFNYKDKCMQNKNSQLTYKFVFPTLPKDRVIHDGPTRELYMRSGLCNTVSPTIKGAWHQLNMSEASPYTFHSSRTFSEFLASRRFSTPKNGRKFLQTYELKLYINHAMSHIYEFEEPQLLIEGGICHLLEVAHAQK